MSNWLQWCALGAIIALAACNEDANGADGATNDEVQDADGSAPATGADGTEGDQRANAPRDGMTDGSPGVTPNPTPGSVNPNSDPTANGPSRADNGTKLSAEAGAAETGDPSARPIEDAGANPRVEDHPPAVEPDQPEGTVPMFVAVGHAGRTVLTCDDGRSWVGNRSDDDALRCFDDQAGGIDCDHSSNAGTGIAYGNGWFVATFGWGNPGTIRRSNDGIDWEVVAQGDDEDGLTSSGLAFGSDMFVTGARSPHIAGPNALTWDRAPDIPLGDVWNVRRIAYVPVDGGLFVMFAQDQERRLITSSDASDWEFSPSGAEYCGGNNITYGEGVLMMIGDTGCRSTDGGQTWEPVELRAAASTPTLWTGSEFVYWGLDEDYRDARYTSPDGVDWEQTPVSADTGGVMRLGPVARSPDGTYVAVRGAWQQWYDEQRFYRSTDGIEWHTLPSGMYTGSHPLRQIVFGYGAPSAACPTP